MKTIHKFLDSSDGYILITDTKSNIIYANESIETSKGKNLDQILGKKPGELWGGEMSKEFYSDMWETIANKRKPFISKVRNYNKDGFLVYEDINISPILNQENEVEYFIQIKPKIQNSEDKKVFEADFTSTINNHNNQSGIKLFEMLSKWMIKDKDLDNSKNKDILTYFQQYSELTDVFENLFLTNKTSAKFFDKKIIEESQLQIGKYEKVYKRYYQNIYNYFFFKTNKNSALSEDMTQETFVRAINNINSYQFQNFTYLSYLLMIAHNLLVNHYRNKQSFNISNINLVEDKKLNKKFIHDKIESDLIWKKTQQLKPIEQDILKMMYKEELSVREISKKINKTENATKLALSRARKKLKEMNN